MVRLDEIEHLFRSVRSKMKKLRLARGAYSEEIPAFLISQAISFCKLVLKMSLLEAFPLSESTATNQLEPVPQRWANDISEFEESRHMPQLSDADPWELHKTTSLN